MQDGFRIRWQTGKDRSEGHRRGQYQHDMNQKKLNEALSGVVEDCVNRVGVDLNTGIGAASFLYFRNFRHDRKKYRGLPGGKREVYRSKRAFKGGKAGTEGL